MKFFLLLSVVFGVQNLSAQTQYVGGGAIVYAGEDDEHRYITVYSGSGIPTTQARNVNYNHAANSVTLEINYQGGWYNATVTYASATFQNGMPLIAAWDNNNVGFANNSQFNLRLNYQMSATAVPVQIQGQAYNPITGEAVHQKACHEYTDGDGPDHCYN